MPNFRAWDITASLNQAGNLQFTSANAFSVSGQATGANNLVITAGADTASNTGLNNYLLKSAVQGPAPAPISMSRWARPWLA